ncbi:MAG: DUF3592 domain-containing protein, partial [Catenulispora sp.]|nr:DUF3592 domain-containing protein [Catenulispora sp.]
PTDGEGLVIIMAATRLSALAAKVKGWLRKAGADTSQWMSAPGTVIEQTAPRESAEKQLHLRVQFATIKGQIVVFEDDVDREQLGHDRSVRVMYDPVTPSDARVLIRPLSSARR